MDSETNQHLSTNNISNITSDNQSTTTNIPSSTTNNTKETSVNSLSDLSATTTTNTTSEAINKIIANSIGHVEDSHNNELAIDRQIPKQENNITTTTTTESLDQKQNQDESSTLSTAFTISFDDENNFSRKLGIRDSIRKFAPPKPHTIEKPRPPKNQDNPDNSFTSIESAPPEVSTFSKNQHNRNSTRSSRSNSSRHSNISDSAAFLIDRMLNCNKENNNSLEQELLFSSSKHSSKSPRHHNRHSRNSPASNDKKNSREYLKSTSSEKMAKRIIDGTGYGDIIDHCDDKSDNGTYIVGADPESDAARKKIDELFGVVRAAEASVMAGLKASNRDFQPEDSNETGIRSTGRHSRLVEKKPSFSKERQEHINRLACRTSSSVSRSSSNSSRQENMLSSIVDNRQNRKPRASSRHSRNSSCDRTSSNNHKASSRPEVITRPHHRRSASQTSRQSTYNKELSDADTRSSRSSLHNDNEMITNNGNPLSTHPSMKFNRAFALRRARLGLGDPLPITSRLPSAQSFIGPDVDSINSSNQKRHHQINTNTYRAAHNSSVSSNSNNFSRDDGGRFSLRMKTSGLPGRLNHSANHVTRSNQQNPILDSYISKLSTSSSSAVAYSKTPMTSSTPLNSNQQECPRSYSKIPSQSSYVASSNSMPYQLGDEIDVNTLSPSTYRLLLKTGRLQHSQNSNATTSNKDEIVSDSDNSYNNHRYNFSLGVTTSNSHELYGDGAGSFNEGFRAASGGRRTSNLQLGALDSLVIPAISSLSTKIRTSVCDILIEQAKKLPIENETRIIVEEILPQLTANNTNVKSPTTIEEIDQSLNFDLAKTLRNLKKVEQMVDVISLISNQLPAIENSTKNSSTNLSTSSSPTSNLNQPERPKADDNPS